MRLSIMLFNENDCFTSPDAVISAIMDHGWCFVDVHSFAPQCLYELASERGFKEDGEQAPNRWTNEQLTCGEGLFRSRGREWYQILPLKRRGVIGRTLSMPHQLEDQMMRWSLLCHAMTTNLLGRICELFRLSWSGKDFCAETTNASKMRLFRYRRPKNSHGRSLGVEGIHCDLGLLTVAPRASVPALQVQDRHGDWIDIEKIMDPNQVIIFAGLHLSEITNGQIRALPHRVASEQEGGPYERFSAPFFLRASEAETLRLRRQRQHWRLFEMVSRVLNGPM